MTIIHIVKDNKVTYGSIEKIAPYLGLTSQAVRLWVKSGIKLAARNGYVVYLDSERL